MDRRNSVDRRYAAKNPYGLPDNPKDLVGQSKLDLSVIPETFIIELALAFYEGALKYGRFNWRMRPVKASVYLSAFDRHKLKFMGGEDRDKKTGTHHLAYMGCCIAIMLDATQYGTMIDDRAPRGRLNPDISAWIDGEVMKRIGVLQKMFAKAKPKQFTISDNIFDDIANAQAQASSINRRTASRGKSRKNGRVNTK